MTRRLFLYSDQIDERLAAKLPKGATVGYLPSSPDPERAWFRPCVEFYERLGLRLKFFGLETEFEPGSDLFACDAIHLTGGNTFRFLHWLRERGLIEGLRRYEGVLIGVSAGAILMTPDVSTSYLCGDEPFPGLNDLSGLGLVDFAFAPHCDGNQPDVLAYARSFPGDVYAVPDGGRIEVDGTRIELFGPASKVSKTFP